MDEPAYDLARLTQAVQQTDAGYGDGDGAGGAGFRGGRVRANARADPAARGDD